MTTLTFRVAGNPVPWARTRVVTYPRLRFVNPAALTEWEELIATSAAIAARTHGWRCLPGDVPVSMVIIFHMPIAKSLGKRKREAMLGSPATQSRGDLSNYLKAVEDGIVKSGAVIKDDAQIVDARVRKVWAAAENAGVEVEVTG